MLSSPNLASKPSFRKHSSFDKLFDNDQLYKQWQQRRAPFPFAFPSYMPSSPNKKANAKVYIFFSCFFLIVTVATFLRCSSIDIHIDNTSKPIPGRNAAEGGMHRPSAQTPALKGLGSIYKVGTKGMTDLVIAHIAENTSLQDFRLFLRTLHRSGVTLRADVVLLFSWNSLPSSMMDVIAQEYRSFDRIVKRSMKAQIRMPPSESNASSSASSTSYTTRNASGLCKSCVSQHSTLTPFDRMQQAVSGDGTNIRFPQPIWGPGNAGMPPSNNTEVSSVSYDFGSMVGFGVSELNPDNTFQGFIRHPPLTLRRWACYQMLLGMVRNRFKHVFLTDVTGVVILNDPFSIMGKKRTGLYITLEDRPWGASLGQELVALKIPLDTESKMVFDDMIVLSSPTNMSSARRQLYSHSPADSERGAGDADPTGGIEKKETTNKLGSLHSFRRAGKNHMELHRTGIVGKRKRKSRRGANSAIGGLYERVYGRRMWSNLEENEKKKKLVNSAVIMGSMYQIRGLANMMVTEIVKVALERKNNDAFPDSVLLSYLLHRSSSVLGKRVLDHLHLMNNADSYVHSLVGSEQPYLFTKKQSGQYFVVHGNRRSKRWRDVIQAVQRDICSSREDAMVYIDCRGLM
ncbi:hypothetical protein KP509_10G035000 [Ceratopteris richardii]|uniref:DUF7780 domain-containing protein n=1 Tax=Ceratopteris richardii TaxID=49495 RepID=A0A8T2U0T6_CERRI|nr:hypothetical protein KP509_10G035000 [Ceratopteris richardii]KAH7427224.1 hypothetical protein KP509_10G035000 [Ceratopteris richardii]KAH7427225.1 hypothetical protein KP509_10G035000 [Ceratopteris richardii]